MAEGEDVALLFKIIVIGDAGVGKSNIIVQYTKNLFDSNIKPTLGVEFIMKKMTVNGRLIKLQIWDTAGQEKYRALAKNLYRNAFGVLIVYDISKRKSFDSLRKWIEEARQYATEGASIIIVGNKKDLNDMREVSTEEGQALAQELKCFFLETSVPTHFKSNCRTKVCGHTSALDNSDKMIEKVFLTIAEDILAKRSEEDESKHAPTGTKIDLSAAQPAKGDEKKKGCC